MWAKATVDKKGTKKHLLDATVRDGLGINDITKPECEKLWTWRNSGYAILTWSAKELK
jgi:hypothetical protein